MSSAFDDISLQWQGRTYTIKSDRCMKAIARIEEHITLIELAAYGSERRTVPMSRVASAFASVLRYAGAQVTDEEMYEGIFPGSGNPESLSNAVDILIAIMTPKGAQQALMINGSGASTPEKKDPPAKAGSLKRRLKSSSAMGA